MPRPRQPNAVAVGLGTAVGALLTGGWGGLLTGAATGALVGLEPVPLEDALRQHLSQRGLTFVSLNSASRSAIALTFRESSGMFWVVNAAVAVGATGDVEDALYDRVVASIDEWKQQHA
jgi:hypothetical protein